jgi:hypothetical protein
MQVSRVAPKKQPSACKAFVTATLLYAHPHAHIRPKMDHTLFPGSSLSVHPWKLHPFEISARISFWSKGGETLPTNAGVRLKLLPWYFDLLTKER